MTLALCSTALQSAPKALWTFEGNAIERFSGTRGELHGSAKIDGKAMAPIGSGALHLGQAPSYLDTKTNGKLPGAGSFTVFVFLSSSAKQLGTFFSYSPSEGGVGGADLRLLLTKDGNLRIEASKEAAYELPDLPLNDSLPHAIAVVFDAKQGGRFRDISLYVDGTSYPVKGGVNHPINLGPGGTLVFGRDQISPTNRPFLGQVYSVAIFDEALSSEMLLKAMISPDSLLPGKSPQESEQEKP